MHGAWQSLLTGTRSAPRRALERLVVRAEVAIAAPADTEPERLRAWAREVRGAGPVPRPDDLGSRRRTPGRGSRTRRSPNPLFRRLGPLAPIALRTALGCALAGYASLALGVGRPDRALVTAASLYQANVTLTWSRECSASSAT